ncbi:MAG TPA: inner membrane CreD family protein [Terriglobales bacterium]|nr:inner membrane CreD family protein [Terriglobales bacterium]
MIKRLAAIVLIFACTAGAWVILGGTVLLRTDTQDNRLRNAVGQLWGTVQVQKAPSVYYETVSKNVTQRVESGKTVSEIQTQTITNYVPLKSSQINVSLFLEHRKKGLLWYPTYAVDYSARYVVSNDTPEPREMFISFTFPTPGAVYDNFRFAVEGKELQNIEPSSGTIQQVLKLDPGKRETVEIAYKSQGMSEWGYEFGENVSQVRDFLLNMRTNFKKIDFPQNSISPTSLVQIRDGWQLGWQYSNLLTGVKIGMVMPNKLNPGPWVSKVTFSAPISLFLFFFLLFIITTLRKIEIHPMNYFFLAAAFFSFHLLLAYLVDHISIHAAFFICSAVSILLAVTYMRLVVRTRFALLEIGVTQLVYQVFFSYTFFFEGYTGLVITILCILTLFVVMQMTGKVKWAEVFQKKKS